MSRKTRLYVPDAISSGLTPGRIAPSGPQRTFLLQATGSPTARLYIWRQGGHLPLRALQRSMSTPDRVMLLFAKSQLCRVHFKDQHALIVPGRATFLKSKCLPSVDGLSSCTKLRERHLSDTDGRLSTDINHGRISRSRLEDRQPAKCSVGDSSAGTPSDSTRRGPDRALARPTAATAVLEDLPGVSDEPASFQSNKQERQCPAPSAPRLHHKTSKEINHETYGISQDLESV